MKFTLRRVATLFDMTLRLSVVIALAAFVHYQSGGSFEFLSPSYYTSSTPPACYFPPLTGDDMVDYLDRHASALRSNLKDYNGLHKFAAHVGSRPLFEALRERYAAGEDTVD